jgi:hypothetical protein
VRPCRWIGLVGVRLRDIREGMFVSDRRLRHVARQTIMIWRRKDYLLGISPICLLQLSRTKVRLWSFNYKTWVGLLAELSIPFVFPLGWWFCLTWHNGSHVPDVISLFPSLNFLVLPTPSAKSGFLACKTHKCHCSFFTREKSHMWFLTH